MTSRGDGVVQHPKYHWLRYIASAVVAMIAAVVAAAGAAAAPAAVACVHQMIDRLALVTVAIWLLLAVGTRPGHLPGRV